MAKNLAFPVPVGRNFDLFVLLECMKRSGTHLTDEIRIMCSTVFDHLMKAATSSTIVFCHFQVRDRRYTANVNDNSLSP